MLECLRGARRARQLIGGLESALASLENQQEGLRKLKGRGQDATPRHITRLLLVCNGASTRFLRQVERAAQRHAPGLCVLRLDLDPETCGQLFFGSPRAVKAMLVDHKVWVSRFFESWLEQCLTND